MQEGALALEVTREPVVRTRSATRFAVKLPVELKLPVGSLRVSTRNLSLGGVLVDSPVALMCRTRVVVCVALPGSREELALAGMVRRCEPGALALSFEGLSSRHIWCLGDFLESL